MSQRVLCRDDWNLGYWLADGVVIGGFQEYIDQYYAQIVEAHIGINPEEENDNKQKGWIHCNIFYCLYLNRWRSDLDNIERAAHSLNRR